MNLHYSPINDSELPFFKADAIALYAEDAGGQPMNLEKIEKTIQYLRLNPQNGVVMSIFGDSTYVGYAILINFWSNEYGGIVLYIDELYIGKKFRHQGIASNFIQSLINKKLNDCKAVFLEVQPNNRDALKLYRRLGFKKDENSYLKYTFSA